ncbi:MAG: ParA family protein [Rhodobacteraceae bacterium]|nr:MAG: ParA family protein [Paracoccaceae bacterium]
MAMVATFAQQKGGSGKTTLLTQVAAALIAAGRRVALVDLDPQRSLAGWVDARARARHGELDLAFFESSEWRASGDIRRAGGEADVVMVDCPGAADVLLRAAMRAADLVVIPAQPSAPDAWATRATLKMAAREGALARVVLNRVPPRGGPGETVERLLRDEGAEFVETRIGNRIAFANAFLEGLGVTETPRGGKAAEEIAALTAELRAVLG